MKGVNMEIQLKLDSQEANLRAHLINRTGFTDHKIYMRALRGLYRQINLHVGNNSIEQEIDSFIDEFCVMNEKFYITVKEWKILLEGHFKFAFSQKAIAAYMYKKGLRAGRVYVLGRQQRCWIGLRLKNKMQIPNSEVL